MMLEPREYQKSIVETAKRANTLVVLPTGVGKTLIALLLAIHRLKENVPSKIVMLAPTRPLVEQHLASFKKQLPDLFAEINSFTGEIPAKERQMLWERTDILFSTPQCIANDLRKGLYNLHDVSLLVIDEAHRCLKNYDYTAAVSFYKNQAKNQRVLGLTASPGSDREKVRQICQNLNITEVELRTRESPDVQPYLQDLEFKKIEVEFPKEFIELRVLLKRLYDSKVLQLKERSLLFGPVNKITLLKLQTSLARQASTGNGNAMQGMSLCAQAIKIAHALELLETQTLGGLNTYMQNLMQQAKEAKSRGVQILTKSPEFTLANLSLSHLLQEKIEHPKIDKITELVLNELELNPEAKVLIFTQFRETANIIIRALEKRDSVRGSIFIGQAKKANGGMSQKKQKEIIESFREGKINVLCATSIGEEGLDIPEVNAVLFYEPIPSAIRKIQRAGRTARNAKGKLFILVTKDTRDEINHYVSAARERKMYRTISEVKEEIKKPNEKIEFS